MSGLISYFVFFSTIAMILSIAVLGLNLQWGYTGLFNGGVVAFFAAGAYGLILLGGPVRENGFGGFELPWIVALAGGVLFAGGLAWLVGLATTKLRHDYLAIATFGVAIAIESVARNAEYLTGGALGLRGFERPLETIIGDPYLFNLFYATMVLGFLVVVYLMMERLVRSPFGRLLRAIREDEVAAQSLGKSPSKVRLQSFVLGAMVMGLAGGLYATYYAYISPQDIATILTFQIWAMLIVGGSGNNKGAILGTFIVWGTWVGSGWFLSKYAPEGMQLYAGSVQYILIGLIIVAALLARPKGILPEELEISTAATTQENR